MITQSRDTNFESEKIQINLLRKANMSARFILMQSLTSSVIYLSREAISKAYPLMNKKELGILFVKINYGEKLANKLSDYLNNVDDGKI